MRDCGNASNYRYSTGCRCDACRRAHSLAVKARELRKLRGETYFVDVGPVRERLLVLYAMGYTKRELERFGVCMATQDAIVGTSRRTGRPMEKVSRKVAERIESVSGRRMSPGQTVSAEAATLMVREWMDAGLSTQRIADVTGITRQVIGALYRGKRLKVRVSTLVALLEHREELDDIASPEPKRCSGDSVCARFSDWELEEAYVEHEAGTPLKSIAGRMGTDPSQLSKWLRKIGDRRAS